MYQYVAIEDVVSSKQKVICGVPQGSILGLLLFLLFINSITLSYNLLQVVLFADVTNLFCCNKSIEVLQQIVNNELYLLSTWFSANKLIFAYGYTVHTCELIVQYQDLYFYILSNLKFHHTAHIVLLL